MTAESKGFYTDMDVYCGECGCLMLKDDLSTRICLTINCSNENIIYEVPPIELRDTGCRLLNENKK